jgi:hypothetical protein
MQSELLLKRLVHIVTILLYAVQGFNGVTQSNQANAGISYTRPRPISSKSFIQGVKKVTQRMAYLGSVFPGRLISKRLWPPRSSDISPQTSFYGGISRILYIQIIHTHYKSFRPTFSALWTGYQLAHCKTCSLTRFVVCISVKSVMVDIFSTYYKK